MTFSTDVSVMYSMLVAIEIELSEESPSLEKIRSVFEMVEVKPCLKCGYIMSKDATACANCGKPSKEVK